MLPADVLRQVRRLHLRARRLVQTLLGGEYHSAFKGAGLSFEEVREYQPGDDVRTIDWNVTARTGHPFIKRYVEERELTMLLVVDVSASQRFGTGLLTKRAAAAELAALLRSVRSATTTASGWSRSRRRSSGSCRRTRDRGTSCGCSATSSRSSRRSPAPTSPPALDYVVKVQRRRAIVFAIGDFLGTGLRESLPPGGPQARPDRGSHLRPARTRMARGRARPAAGRRERPGTVNRHRRAPPSGEGSSRGPEARSAAFTRLRGGPRPT